MLVTGLAGRSLWLPDSLPGSSEVDEGSSSQSGRNEDNDLDTYPANEDYDQVFSRLMFLLTISNRMCDLD